MNFLRKNLIGFFLLQNNNNNNNEVITSYAIPGTLVSILFAADVLTFVNNFS